MSTNPEMNLGDWLPRPAPAATERIGRYAQLEPLQMERHGKDLYRVLGPAERWRWLPVEMPASWEAFAAWGAEQERRKDMEFFAVVDRSSGTAVGFQALMRIVPDHGVLEMGWVFWSQKMARTRLATEAFALFAAYVFDELGYRRFEWKCDAANGPSRKAASRFGFQYEGTFRQDRVVKGINRDTAWFSILDSEWPDRARALEAWLDEANFDPQGQQMRSLGDCLEAGPGSSRA